MLHNALLEHVWRIPDDSPEHIAYIHDTAATVEKAERDGGTAVLLHPSARRSYASWPGRA